MFFQRLGGRLEGRRYVDGFAYVKIEARSLARAQCGKVSRFVLFAADIPSIAEPFSVGAPAGEYSSAGPARLGKALVPRRITIHEYSSCTKDLVSVFQRIGRQLRQRGSRSGAQCQNDFWR